MNNAQILLNNNFVAVESAIVNPFNAKDISMEVGTIVSNLAYFLTKIRKK